jgi:SAM-dependent methyltransferase
MTSYRDRCASCGQSHLIEIIDLGMHPLADTFIPADRQYQADRLYPLVCDMCTRCGQIQLRTITDPAERYCGVDYSYTSSNSSFSRGHWTQYAKDVGDRVGLTPGAQVIEIGSNDGFLSARFQERGALALGVDPSPAMARLARDNGVTTHEGLFGSALARTLGATLPARPHLIVANNVVNHANDPLDFAHGIAALLAPDGTFVFELPYWLRTVTEGKFDQIYHEHVSYFTVTHAEALFKAAGMVVVHAEEVQYHGGSIRVYVRHTGQADDDVRRLMALEREHGLFDVETYRVFVAALRARRDRFLATLFSLRAAGAAIVCVGAAAKANTFLNFYRLDKSIVDWVTDASPAKIGKWTPATRIPIGPDDVIRDYDAVHAILTSWNLAHILRPALQRINPRVQFLDPFEAH